MKRLLLALGLLLGIMHFSSAANAQAIVIGPCTQSGNVGTIVYPYVFQCTGATASQASAVYTALNNAPGQTTVTTLGSGDNAKSYSLQSWMKAQQTAYKDKKTGHAYPVGGAFYVFDTPADFVAFATAYFPAGLPIPTAAQLAGDAGVTVYPASAIGPGLYSVVFTEVTVSGKTYANAVPGTSGAHEVGHYMDWLFAALVGNAGGLVSNTAAYYQMELTQDWNTLNASQACYDTQNGVFTGLADDTGLTNTKGPYFICDGTGGTTGYKSNGEGTALNTDYAGNNETVLADAWPYIYKKGSTANNAAQPWKELFAETYGAGSQLDGVNDGSLFPQSGDNYLGYNGAISTTGGFVCTREFMSWMVQINSLPKKASPPPGWPTGCPLF